MLAFWWCFLASAQDLTPVPCSLGTGIYPCLHNGTIIFSASEDPNVPQLKPDFEKLTPKSPFDCPDGYTRKLVAGKPDANGSRSLSHDCVKDTEDPEPAPRPNPEPSPRPSPVIERDQPSVRANSTNEPRPPEPLPQAVESEGCRWGWPLSVLVAFISGLTLRARRYN